MEIPEGIECSNEVRKRKVCKLKKALYGLKVSPKCWNEKFKEKAAKMGLTPDPDEPCLFSWNENNKILILILYVGDILITGNDCEKIQEVKRKLNQDFEMSDIGEPNNYLGLEIERDKEAEVLKVSQQKYTDKILKRFGYENCHPQRTPMTTNQVSNKERIRT